MTLLRRLEKCSSLKSKRKEHIEACHRLGAIKGGEKRGVTVKFTRRSKKEE